MRDKIRQYVNYQFRFEKEDEVNELKEEIIANLNDRYNEHLNLGKDQDEAYIAAIKSMGDFSNNKINDIPDEYKMKPSIPDILLMSGAILSIFGLLLTLLNVVAGTIGTAVSILLFSGSAYYLYSLSQHVRKEQLDIEKHNLILGKIFKYMKTSFAFWAISLSLITALVVKSTIIQFILIDPNSISFELIRHYHSLSIYVFFIALVIFIFIFKAIYDRLMNHYYILTGNKELKGKIRESYEFLYRSGKLEKKNIFNSRFFIPIIGLAMILPQLFIGFTYTVIRTGNFMFSHNTNYLYGLMRFISRSFYGWVFIIPLISLIFSLFLIILSLSKIKIKQVWLVVSYYIYLSSGFVLYIIVQEQLLGIHDLHFSEEPSIYSFVTICLLTIILIVKRVITKRKKV